MSVNKFPITGGDYYDANGFPIRVGDDDLPNASGTLDKKVATSGEGWTGADPNPKQPVADAIEQ